MNPYLAHPMFVAVIIFLFSIYWRQWTRFRDNKLNCEIFFLNITNVINRNSDILEDLKPLRDFDSFDTNDHLTWYNPKEILNYPSRDIIFFCVYSRKLKYKKILRELYCELEFSIKLYTVHVEYLLSAEEEYHDIIESSTILNSNKADKHDFVADYNEAIDEIKRLHNEIKEYIQQINQYPLRGKRIYLFA